MILLLLFLSVPQGVLIDRVVAVIDKEVVTESEVRAEARLALAYRHGGSAATAPLAPEFMDNFLWGYLTNQLLIAAQARRVGLEVPDEDVSRERQYLVGQFSSATAYDAFLAHYLISEKMVVAILRRGLQNGRYLMKRLGIRTVGSRILFDWPKDNRTLTNLLRDIRRSGEIQLRLGNGELEPVHTMSFDLDLPP
jgi:hypothetical protein